MTRNIMVNDYIAFIGVLLSLGGLFVAQDYMRRSEILNLARDLEGIFENFDEGYYEKIHDLRKRIARLEEQVASQSGTTEKDDDIEN